MRQAARGNVITRPALPAESGVVAEIMRAAFAEHRGRIRPDSSALEETAESVAEFLRAHRIFVAEIEGRLVGSVQAKVEDDGVYLGRLSVLPDHRRIGVADRLLAAVESYAREIGAGAVFLKVRVELPQNQHIFLSRGFQEVGREAHAGFDHPTSIRMRKAVGAR
jgi:ribosomal protein S18 acetylase RimI-like enzyme